MIKSRQNRRKKNQGGARYTALVLLVLIVLVVGGYLAFGPPTPVVKPAPHTLSTSQKIPLPSKPHSLPQSVISSTSSGKVDKTYSEEPKSAGSGSGRMAILVDDMGGSMQEARSLAGIGVPLTFSIIPGLHAYQEVASFAASSGIETMIHIPMQSRGWPQRRLEANGLLISMGNKEIRASLSEFLQEMPEASGANNHMGSEFTEHEDKMRPVLSALKEKGLFFVDSVTSPNTVGSKLARELGIKSGRRNVFLDNEQNSTYITGQLNQAVRLARKNGSAIVICHPHPATIKTLISLLPTMERQGITLVSASQLVK